MALLFVCALALPAGACPNGRCFVSGPSAPPLKGSPSRLQRITATTSEGITVGDKKYLIDSDAIVVVNGRFAEKSAIQPGMRVMVSCKVVDRDKHIYKATRVMARNPESKGRLDE